MHGWLNEPFDGNRLLVLLYEKLALLLVLQYNEWFYKFIISRVFYNYS